MERPIEQSLYKLSQSSTLKIALIKKKKKKLFRKRKENIVHVIRNSLTYALKKKQMYEILVRLSCRLLSIIISKYLLLLGFILSND